jgi:hypothetical protein
MKKLKNIAAWLFVALLTASLFMNIRHYYNRDRASGGIPGDTVRITIVDTIAYFKPEPTAEKQVAAVTGRLPLANPQKRGNNDEAKNTPILELADSVDVVIPITQKVYEDSTYRAVISGYNASLDELLIFPRKEIITIKQVPKPKRWSIGIQAGYGIPLNLKGAQQFAPYIGIGIQYNLFNF